MTAYKSVLHFDSVIVIESLKPNEKRTGRNLYDNVLKGIEEADPQLRMSYIPVSSPDEFFAALDAARNQFFEKGKSPILHLEAHGTEAGIRMRNDDLVEWEDLRRVLTDMNKTCGMNLFLVMAMCKGWHLSRLLSPVSQSPVWGLIGPTVDVRAPDLQVANEVFYRVLFESLDGFKALDAMNKNLPIGGWTYRFQSAELMYCSIMDNYAQKLCTDEQLKERENELVAEIVRRSGLNITPAPGARLAARKMLEDHQAVWDYYRSGFLMLDLFPDQADRFSLTFDDCMRQSEPSP